jgi:hypothetical protein
MILFTSGTGLVFPASGFLASVGCFFCSISCLFWSADLSGASNLMIFRSGSGFFSGCSLGFGNFVSCGAGTPGDVSAAETGSSFPNFSFIATPPCELIFAESQGISTRI